MRFPPSFLEEIKARLPVSEVVRRRVKLTRAGREWKGLSPFTVEKTPSFFANDQKQAWFDFSAGKNGDIFTFLMETEGLSFDEAVKHLAHDAGLALPQASPAAAAREKARASLHEALDLAARYFSDVLAGREGKAARDYLVLRGIDGELQQHFRLGYALPEKYALRDHLAGKGVPLKIMIEAGLLIHGEDITVPYDRFRGRIMFPIADPSGRVIAFGGRTLEKEAQPKYLNSPETALFHKGAILYNHHNARKAVQEGSELIVVEGYADVIAMTSAGFSATVAPLGTALTADHCELLWRMGEEPILCFDGDRAGRKAAYRAIDLALPLIGPARSLRFALLPDGCDPDDLARSGGCDAVGEVLGAAKPLSELIWLRETENRNFTTPERQARLEERLRQIAGQIRYEPLRRLYQDDFKDRLFRFRRSRHGERTAPQRRLGGGPKALFETNSARAAPEMSLSLKTSPLLRPGTLGHPVSESLILQLLLNHPGLIGRHIEELAEIEFESKDAKALRDALIAAAVACAGTAPLDKTGPGTASLRAALEAQGLGEALQKLDANWAHASHWYLKAEAAEEDADRVLEQALAWHRRRALEKEFQTAMHAFETDPSEDNCERMIKLRGQLNALGGTEAAIEGFGVLSGRTNGTL